MRSARCWAAIATAIGVVLTLAACGADGTPSAESAAASSSRTTAGAQADAGYSGAEKGLPTQYARPVKKAGEKFVVGMLSPTQSEPLLQEITAAASAEAKKLGGTLIVKDAQVSPDKQVSQFNELLTQV